MEEGQLFVGGSTTVVHVWTDLDKKVLGPSQDRPEIRARAHFRMSSLQDLKLRATI